MEITKNIKWVIGALCAVIFVFSCCVIGVIARPATSSVAPTAIPTNTLYPTMTVAKPTITPSPVPTIDSFAACKREIIQWRAQSSELITLIDQSMRYLESNAVQAVDTYIDAVNLYKSIPIPECDNEAQLANLRMGEMLLEVGKVIESTSNEQFIQHIKEATNLANQIIALMDVVNVRYNLK